MYGLEADRRATCKVIPRVKSSKTTEISREGHVNLAYSHPSKQHYISLSGRAEIVRDKGHIQDKWSEPLRTWFPKARMTRSLR